MSVGSNDLLKFASAANRGSERVTARYDSLSVPFPRRIDAVASTCSATGIPVMVCG